MSQIIQLSVYNISLQYLSSACWVNQVKMGGRLVYLENRYSILLLNNAQSVSNNIMYITFNTDVYLKTDNVIY